MFRLDAYSAATGCAGSTVPPGESPPLISRLYAKGARIALDVPAGDYTLVLTAFADIGASRTLGQGCLVTSLVPSEEACFDLTIVGLPDMTAETSLDLARVADLSVPSDLAVTPDLSPPLPPVANGTYKIINRVSGLALDDTANDGVGSPLDQYNYHAAPNQQWTLQIVNNRYTVTCLRNGFVASGNGSSAPGAPVILATEASTPTATQLWTIIELPDGAYLIINGLSGEALTDPNGSTTLSVTMDQEAISGQPSQEWSILPP